MPAHCGTRRCLSSPAALLRAPASGCRAALSHCCTTAQQLQQRPAACAFHCALHCRMPDCTAALLPCCTTSLLHRSCPALLTVGLLYRRTLRWWIDCWAFGLLLCAVRFAAPSDGCANGLLRYRAIAPSDCHAIRAATSTPSGGRIRRLMYRRTTAPSGCIHCRAASPSVCCTVGLLRHRAALPPP